jgi:hypothetical protein
MKKFNYQVTDWMEEGEIGDFEALEGLMVGLRKGSVCRN